MILQPSELILSSLLRQRYALAELRKKLPLSHTDIEVLAYAKRKKLFTVYELKQYYAKTNIQQLRTSIQRLESNNLLDLVKKGYKNKPSVYWLSSKGENAIDTYVAMIS